MDNTYISNDERPKLHIYTNASVDWAALESEWLIEYGDFEYPGFWVKPELPSFAGQTVIGGDTSEWDSSNTLEEWKSAMTSMIERFKVA